MNLSQKMLRIITPKIIKGATMNNLANINKTQILTKIIMAKTTKELKSKIKKLLRT